MSIVPGSQTPGNGCGIFIDGFQLVHAHERTAGKEVHVDVVEGVLEIWCSLGSIHSVTSDTLFIFSSISSSRSRTRLLGRVRPSLKSFDGVVLDAENVAVVEPLASGERVVPGIELEAQEVGGGHELRLERLLEHVLDRRGRIAGWRPAPRAAAAPRRAPWPLLRAPSRATFSRSIQRSSSRARSSSLICTPSNLHRAADEIALPDEPGVFAGEAVEPDCRPGRTAGSVPPRRGCTAAAFSSSRRAAPARGS